MIVFDKPKALTDAPLHYCPGCTHGIIHRLVAEAIDSLGIAGDTIGVASVGCSVFTYNYFNVDMDKCIETIVLDIKKTVFELGYEPKYSWKDYLIKFKEEMETQPFAKIWGVESDYYKLEE